jgi:hypothetical protein
VTPLRIPRLHTSAFTNSFRGLPRCSRQVSSHRRWHPPLDHHNTLTTLGPEDTLTRPLPSPQLLLLPQHQRVLHYHLLDIAGALHVPSELANTPRERKWAAITSISRGSTGSTMPRGCCLARVARFAISCKCIQTKYMGDGD